MANLLTILGTDGRTTCAMLAGATLRHAARESGCKLDVDVCGPDTISIVGTAALTITEAVVWAGFVSDAAARHANLRTPEITFDKVLADARVVSTRMIGNTPPAPRVSA